MTTTIAVEDAFSSYSMPRPAWATERNPLRPTYGTAVGLAAALLGKPLMPWQQYVVDVGLEVQSVEAGDPDPGSWAYTEVGVSVQRQAGKTFLVRPLVIHRMRKFANSRTWITAQKRINARRRWMDATDALMQSALKPDLRRKTGVMHEELRTRENDSTFEPFAPDGESLHGETPDLVLVDEYWAFDAEEGRELRQAYEPGFTTKDGQAWILSTAGTVASAALNALRGRGRRAVEEGKGIGLAWFEWGLPDTIGGVPVEDLPDEALIEAVISWHPARGYTLREQSIRNSFASMTETDYATGRMDFLRAYGNRTPSSNRARLIPLDVWRAARTVLPVEGRLVLGFAVDQDSERASITVACRLEGDRIGVDTTRLAGSSVVETIAAADGVSWLVPRIVEVVRKHSPALIAYNDQGPTHEAADLLRAALEVEGLECELLAISARDYAAACMRVDRELREQSFLHRGEDSLDRAAEVVGKRTIGLVAAGAWGWKRTSDPICELESATVAVWGVDHAPAEDSTRFQIW